MLRFSRGLQNYLLFALPFVVGAMVWSSMLHKGYVPATAGVFAKIAWELLSWNLIAWFVALAGFFILILTHRQVREQVLKRPANIRDDDEREEWITGKASRTAYLATLSVLAFLLFFSIFTFQIAHRSDVSAQADAKYSLSIGLSFDLLESMHQDARPAELTRSSDVVFENHDLPLSKTGLLLLVILWQFGSYYLSAKRELAS